VTLRFVRRCETPSWQKQAMLLASGNFSALPVIKLAAMTLLSSKLCANSVFLLSTSIPPG
jgi:hypothetical protein